MRRFNNADREAGICSSDIKYSISVKKKTVKEKRYF